MEELKSIFSEEDCNKILKNYLVDDYKDIKYLSQKFQSLSGVVEGYLSEHYSLTITYQDNEETKDKTFFVKAVLQQKGFLDIFAKAMDVFGKESFIYTTFFPPLKKLKNFKQISPTYYLSKENILVLEDLTQSGFATAERLKFFNIDQCKIALRTLSYYHAYSIIFEEIKSEETHTKYRLNEAFPVEFMDRFSGEHKSSPTAQFLESSLTTLINLVQELPEDVLEHKVDFAELLTSSFEATEKEEQISGKYRRSCIHGDLWASNIMFKYGSGKLVDCRLIDYQMLLYSMPASDVELFFHGNTSSEFRSKYKQELLHYYYDNLQMILEENNIDGSKILTFKELEESCVLCAPEAKVQAINDMSLLYLPEELLIEAKRNTDFFKSVLIDDRSKYVLDIYKSNTKYRDIMNAELVDLYHILMEKKKFLDGM